MSGSVNKITLIGHLGDTPQLQTFPDGTPYTRISLATSDHWKDKATGEKKSHTEWHRLFFTGNLAKIVCEYLTKGSHIYVEGQNRTRPFTPEWATKPVYVTEVFATSMKMLDKKPADSIPAGAPRDDVPPMSPSDLPGAADDDLPQ